MSSRKTSHSKIQRHRRNGSHATSKRRRRFGNKPRAGKKKAGALFEALVALQARLRAPGGCPWDREQTHQTLRTYLVEETYEVLDALDSGDASKFAGELGDLLLQVVFHSGLAAEVGRFNICDVIEHVHNKMVRRHPHVFGEIKARTAAEVLKNWEEIKAEERRTEQKSAKGRRAEPAVAGPVAASILDGVPRVLPALLEAHQLSRRAANVGFDWKHVDGLFDKLAEEIAEVRHALASNDRGHLEEEVGDLLFVGVNLARFLGLDAEIALKKSNAKFSRRFREMERIAAADGRQLPSLSAAELEELWSEAKTREAERAVTLREARAKP